MHRRSEENLIVSDQGHIFAQLMKSQIEQEEEATVSAAESVVHEIASESESATHD